MTVASQSRTKVFISYSHADQRHLDQLLIHLQPLMRDRVVDVWVDTMLEAGDSWRSSIERAIASAQVAIVLVSAPYRASKFIAENELPPLLAAAKNEGMLILPIVVGACDFHDSEFAEVQAVNNPSQPLGLMPKPRRDAVWVKVARRINAFVANGSGEADATSQPQQQSLSGRPRRANVSQSNVTELLRLGAQLNKAQHFDDAKKVLRLAATREPHNPEVWFEYTYALAKLDQKDAAINAFIHAYDSAVKRETPSSDESLLRTLRVGDLSSVIAGVGSCTVNHGLGIRPDLIILLGSTSTQRLAYDALTTTSVQITSSELEPWVAIAIKQTW